MSAHHTTAVVREDGCVVLDQVPFQSGDKVDVLVYKSKRSEGKQARYPLHGTPVRFDHPTAPVCEEDWESAK